MAEKLPEPADNEILCFANLAADGSRVTILAKGRFHGGGHRLGLERATIGGTFVCHIVHHPRRMPTPLYNKYATVVLSQTRSISPEIHRVIVYAPDNSVVKTFELQQRAAA